MENVRISAVARLALILALIASLLAGCSSGNKLVGKWQTPAGTLDYEFRENGTYQSKVKTDAGNTIQVDGNWSYSGTTLHIDPKTFSATGPNNPEAEKQKILKGKPGPTDTTLEWQDNDHFTFVEGGDTNPGLALERKK